MKHSPIASGQQAALCVTVSPALPDGRDDDRFARFCHLLLQFRREDEAKGHRYLDAQGNPLPPLGQEDSA